MEKPTPNSSDKSIHPIAKLKIGDRIGRFRVTGKLGRGTMGWVVRATDVTLARGIHRRALVLHRYKRGQ